MLWYDGASLCQVSAYRQWKTLLVWMTSCYLLTDHAELLIAVVCEKSNTKREDATHACSAKWHRHLPV